MKTQDEEVTSWDDMMFENRNKEYGAYTLRKSYSENMITGEVLTFFFIAFLFVVPHILTRLGFNFADPLKNKVKEIIIYTSTQPSMKREEKPEETPKTQSQNKKAVPVVTSNTQEDDTTAMTDPVEPDLGTGDAVFVDPGPTGGGDDVVPDPPVEDVNPTHLMSEKMPEYNGGLEAMSKFLQRNIKYPAADKRIGTEGTVFVSFVIDRSGIVKDVGLVRGISSGCDKEAMRVIAMMPSWKPGANNKIPVSVRMVLPIKFTLER